MHKGASTLDKDSVTKSTSAVPFKPGDLVMHATHGLGRFSGMRAMGDADGQYLQLDYASGDRVFVPLENLDRITKYVGDEVDVARLTSKESPTRSPYARPANPNAAHGPAAAPTPTPTPTPPPA
jgi:transcription-repair coupling factor (superfamily II helicase)